MCGWGLCVILLYDEPGTHLTVPLLSLCVVSLFHVCRMAEAQAHASLGYIYELLRDTDKAIDHYERRLRIALDVIDKGAEARSYCSIGNCLRAIMQPEKALECYNRVSSLSTHIPPLHLLPPIIHPCIHFLPSRLSPHTFPLCRV